MKGIWTRNGFFERECMNSDLLFLVTVLSLFQVIVMSCTLPDELRELVQGIARKPVYLSLPHSLMPHPGIKQRYVNVEKDVSVHWSALWWFCFQLFQFYFQFRFYLRQWWLAGLDVENTVKCHNWPYGYHHWSGSLGDMTVLLVSNRPCLQHGQTRTLAIVVCSQYCYAASPVIHHQQNLSLQS